MSIFQADIMLESNGPGVIYCQPMNIT